MADIWRKLWSRVLNVEYHLGSCWPWIAVLICAIIGSNNSTTIRAADQQNVGHDFFEKKIRPVLAEHCFKCHSAEAEAASQLKGGLRLDRRDTALKGGESGPVIISGHPADSLLISALRYDSLSMPPDGRLPDEIVNDFIDWIRGGAPWPADDGVNEIAQTKLRDYEYWRSNHWAWRPMHSGLPPEVMSIDDSENAIDRFIIHRLEIENLTPSPIADRATLVRRVYFDLLGLPPTFVDTMDFIKDKRPDAYQRLVDRLLASPAFGERWGRHWLDVARYADNGGFNSQTKELYSDFHFAYTYRDYVVRAFNEDLPYDRFIVEQLAADKLDLGEDNRALAAMGFLSLGDKSFGTSREDRIDDCIDTVTSGLMGITVSCARCHDHKYDPVPTEDYYSLFSVFGNSNIDVAARVHDIEKTAGFPPIFQTHKERLAFESNLAAETDRLERARHRFFAEALEHCRQRAGDYMLAAADLAADERKEGLSEKLIEQWRAFLKTAADKNDPVFSPWQAVAGQGTDPTPGQIRDTLAQFEISSQSGSSSLGNALILNELYTRPPQSVEDVADAYSRVLADVYRRLNASEQIRQSSSEDQGAIQNRSLTIAEPDEYPDEAALVTLLTVEGSPLRPKKNEALKLPIHGGKQELEQLRGRVRAAKFDYPRAVAVSDKNQISDHHVLVRGNPRKRGQKVPRRYLALLSNAPREPFGQGSGRLQLANAIIDRNNPLTSRVIVNRVWHHHFGSGLVQSTSDFGTRSDPPTHPELLDTLASTFVDDGWSLKRLHRRILLSRTYRQSSLDRPEIQRVDPDNRLLWRMNRRRVEFEVLRDTLLAVSGQLDTTIGGPPVKIWESRRRTLYGYVDRYRIAAGYLTFDYPNPSRTAPKRTHTLVPQQALFLMNSQFARHSARHVVDRAELAEVDNDAKKVELIYRWIVQRDPSNEEADAASRLIASSAPEGWQQLVHALLLSNEFVYVD